MTKRTEDSPELRWKITWSHTGKIYKYGVGWSLLSHYMHDCYRRGVCFRVELKELHSPGGSVMLDEQERCIGWRDDPIDDLRNSAGRLPDRVLDEQSPQGEPRSDSDRGD